MDKRLHDRLISDIEALRSLLAECSTETIIGMISARFIKFLDVDDGMTSPLGQLYYLMGMMLTSPEPIQPQELDDDRWAKAVDLMERIFYAYAWMYWPTPEETGRQTKEWHTVRDVAMSTFLHYFNSGLMASTEQIRDRIQRYVVPFDEEVAHIFNISASDMLKIADVILQKFQSHFDELKELQRREVKERNELLDEAKLRHWDLEIMRKKAVASPYKKTVTTLLSKLGNSFKIQRTELEAQFRQDTIEAFWRCFSIQRGAVAALTYPTEPNPAFQIALYLIDENTAMVPLVHGVYMAILEKVECALLSSRRRAAFLRQRDAELEKEVAAVFNDFFNNEGRLFQTVFETPDLHYEHDIIIVWRDKVFVIEAKAAPPREPLRDSAKAFVRIRDDFRSDRGIQSAYNQASHIESAHRRGDIVKLYNDKRECVLEISPANTERIYSICITRDNFGVLASDLSLLLEKDQSGPYPWAANVVDLQSLFDAFKYFGWGVERFCEYLDGRERMHGKVTSEDELEYAGYLIAHGKFDYMFDSKFDHMLLNPSYSEVFDRIFLAKRGGTPVHYNPSLPVTTNLTAEVGKWQRKPANGPGRTAKTAAMRKQGRNEPCACGSGKKYKRCCGSSQNQ